jgi:effector-binding domain-containing protein
MHAKSNSRPISPEISETMSRGPFRIAVAGLIAVLASLSFPISSQADQSTPRVAQSAPAPTAAPPSATPAAPNSSSAESPSPTAPEAAKPTEPPKPQGEPSTGETVDLQARPFAFTEGKAGRDEIYSAILGSLGVVKRELDKAGVKPAGRPIAVFVEADDSGFRYHAGYPIAAAPDDKTSLSDAVKIGLTPSGKAMRFEHLGSYADIDATYDAITAYLDEKGIDAQDSFVEEYANDVKDADDPTLQVNIYVLMK